MNTITTTRGFPQITQPARTGQHVRRRAHRPAFDLHEFLGWALFALIATVAALTTLAFVDLTGAWLEATLSVTALSPLLLAGYAIARFGGVDPDQG
jgi:hypothetical protein